MWRWGWLAGCAGKTGAGTDSPPPFEPPGAGEITLTARDGTPLVADYYPQDRAGAPGLVLLHMIPPTWDRTSWPAPFVERMYGLGFSVVALDRRGAGESGGDAEDAYLGPDGRTDVEAAVLRLVADGYGPIALIGASNGTTSMLDYALWAEGEGLPVPVALGFMTGGTYTENNHPMAELGPIPAVFTYSTAERDWSVAQQALDPGQWVFHEYPNGDHGTLMFAAEPSVTDDLASFFTPFAAR